MRAICAPRRLAAPVTNADFSDNDIKQVKVTKYHHIILLKNLNQENPGPCVIARSASDAAIFKGLSPGQKDCFAALAMTALLYSENATRG